MRPAFTSSLSHEGYTVPSASPQGFTPNIPILPCPGIEPGGYGEHYTAIYTPVL